MLTGIGLRNFKAFGNEMQEAPLSKITLIYGPNSGGKSSIIQALLLLKQSLKQDYWRIRRNSDYWEVRGLLDKRHLVTNGEILDLGNFQSLRHKHEDSRHLGIRLKYRDLRLGTNSAENDVLLTFSDFMGLARLLEIRYRIAPCNDAEALFDARLDAGGDGTTSFYNGQPVHARKAAFRILGVTNQKDSHLTMTEFLPILCFPELKHAREEGVRKLGHMEREGRHLLEIQHGVWAIEDAQGLAHTSEADGNLEQALQLLDLSPDETLALTPENIPADYERHLHSVNYLAPLRSAPERLYRLSSENDNYAGITGIQGEFSANVLYHSKEVRDAVNDWFGQLEIPYELDVVKLGETSLSGEYITIALYLLDKERNRIMDNGGKEVAVTLADVGYGINQILPVIIEGIASQEGSILCVEQPEIHLHPRLQANIADLMIDAIADEPGKRKQWIVETHSELLITRIQRRIREGKIKSEDISVLYVDPDDEYSEGSAIIKLRLDENGDFKDHWPHGFFDEAFNELMAEPEQQMRPAD